MAFLVNFKVAFLFYTVSTFLFWFTFRFLLLINCSGCKQTRSTGICTFRWFFVFIVIFEVISEYSEIYNSGHSGCKYFPIWTIVAEICVPSIFIQVIELSYYVEMNHLMKLWPIGQFFKKWDIEILYTIIRIVTIPNNKTWLSHTICQVPYSFKNINVFVPVDKSWYCLDPHRKVQLRCVITELHRFYMIIKSKSRSCSSYYRSNQINISIPQLLVVMSWNLA